MPRRDLLQRFVGTSVLTLGTQLLSACIGIVLVRILSKADYSFFAVFLAASSTGALLMNLGLNITLSAHIARQRDDAVELNLTVATYSWLNVLLGLLSLSILLPFSYTMLDQLALSPSEIGLTLAAIAAAAALQQYVMFWAAISSGLERPSLGAFIVLVQALYRMVMILPLLLFPGQLQLVALQLTALAGAALYVHWQRPRILKGFLELESAIRPRLAELAAAFTSVRPHIVSTIYFALQGGITVFVASLFSAQETIANVSALSRFALLFAVANTVNNSVFLPLLSRRRTQRRLTTVYFALNIGFASLLTGLAYVFPQMFLFILGPQYYGLDLELSLSFLSASVAHMTGMLYIFLVSHDRAANQYLAVPATLLMQCLALSVLDISSTAGVQLFSIFGALGSLLVQILLFAINRPVVNRR